MITDLFTGQQFGIAVCEQFKLDGTRVHEVSLESGHNKILAINLRIAVTAQELAEIARRMDAMVQV
jgi:hypothetical protein